MYARSVAITVLCALLAVAAPASGARAAPVRVFAASSLTEALDLVLAAYRKQGGGAAVGVYASSVLLARQISGGAPADIYISADRRWMDFAARAGKIGAGSRVDLLSNRLVLIARAGTGTRISIAKGPAFAGALNRALGAGRLAIGEPESVPAGIYARTALTRLGAWEAVRDRLAPAANVRIALAFVARGETPLGIVYRTDALAEPRTRIVATFPEGSHPPIVYPAALIKGAQPAARALFDYLTGVQARPIFAAKGFGRPQ